MSTAFDYWASGRGMDNITPRGKEWPEGVWFRDHLASIIGLHKRVLEFGCGPGRIAALFSSSKYVGVDICPHALAMAQVRLPNHRFLLLRDVDLLPEVDITLAHTVLVHVPDDKLHPTVSRFQSKEVVISEVMGREWRRAGDPPVFNRERCDYESVMWPHYDLVETRKFPYEHYTRTSLTMLFFRRRPEWD